VTAEDTCVRIEEKKKPYMFKSFPFHRKKEDKYYKAKEHALWKPK